MILPNHYLKLIDNLNSAYWNERSKALEEIKSINDSEVIFEIYKEVQRRNDNNLRFQLLVVFEFLLQSNKEDMSGIAICGLIQWKEKANDGLGTKSGQLINDYIHSPSILRYLKIKSIRYAWSHLPKSKRYTLTEVISKNQLRELSSNLISNFKIRDEDLWILTIKTLIRFKDGRVLKSVKKILSLNLKNIELNYQCILALGKLGSFFDSFLVNKYLKDSNTKIQVATVRALSELLGLFAVSKLREVLEDDYSDKVKYEAVSRLGKLNSRSSCKVLVNLLKSGLSGDLGLQVEWALHDIDNRVKIPILINEFQNGIEHDKMKILNFLTDVYDQRLESFILNTLKSKESEMIKMMTMNLSSNCQSDRVVNALEKYIGQFEGLLSYTAMIELYEINQFKNSDILEQFFEAYPDLDNLCHQIVLKALVEGPVAESLHEYVILYIEKIFSSKRLDLIHLALDVAVSFPSIAVIEELIILVKRTKIDTIVQSARRALAEIVSQRPIYIPQVRALFNDEEFCKDLKLLNMSVDFIDELSVFIKTVGHEHFENTIEYLREHIEGNATTYFNGVGNVDSFFELWVLCNLRLDEEGINQFIADYYPKLSEENKMKFLYYLSIHPHHKYHDFFYRELIEREEQLSHILNPYLGQCDEVMNE